MIHQFMFVLLLGLASSKTYERYQVLRANPTTIQHLEYLESLREEHDVWYASHDRFDILLPSSSIPSFTSTMLDIRLSFKVVIDDVLKKVNEEVQRLSSKPPGFDYDDFNNLTLCYEELHKIADKCIPGFVCSIDSIGDSIEKRPIKRLTINKKDGKRKAIYVDATTHACEWLTTATIFKIMKHIQDKYNVEKNVTELLDKYDLIFIPVVNPDGYAFSWNTSNSTNRYWRKNRNPNPGASCMGVDLNRNADHAWGTEGSSGSPCSQTYRGESVASEPEIKVLQKHFQTYASKILEVISIHAHGQYWLISFGHIDNTTKKCYVAPDAEETMKVANAAANAIESVYNTSWARGPSCNTIYPVSGATTDYAKSKAGIKYTAVPEVRGDDYIVPPSEIHPSFKEIWAGMLASIKAIEKNQN